MTWHGATAGSIGMKTFNNNTIIKDTYTFDKNSCDEFKPVSIGATSFDNNTITFNKLNESRA